MQKEFKIVEQNADGSAVLYSRSKMPLMSDRDNVIWYKSEDRPDGRYLYEVKSIEHADCPPVKGVIRMQMLKLSLTHQEGDDLVMEEFTNMDMGGYFPAKLMNMAMAGMMQKGISDFKAKLQKIQDEL